MTLLVHFHYHRLCQQTEAAMTAAWQYNTYHILISNHQLIWKEQNNYKLISTWQKKSKSKLNHHFKFNNIHFIHFWNAPLRVRSAKRRHQSPEWAILSQVDCFVQGEVKWFQVLLDSLHPHGARASWWSPPVLQGGRTSASVSSGSVTKQGETPHLDNGREGHCSVVRLISSFRTWWYHLIPLSLHRHHWSRASILSASLLVTRSRIGKSVECKYYTASTTLRVKWLLVSSNSKVRPLLLLLLLLYLTRLARYVTYVLRL